MAPLAALPEELILFQRVLTLLRGLCTQVGHNVPALSLTYGRTLNSRGRHEVMLS